MYWGDCSTLVQPQSFTCKLQFASATRQKEKKSSNREKIAEIESQSSNALVFIGKIEKNF